MITNDVAQWQTAEHMDTLQAFELFAEELPAQTDFADVCTVATISTIACSCGVSTVATTSSHCF
jgi:hypothetical protein